MTVGLSMDVSVLADNAQHSVFGPRNPQDGKNWDSPTSVERRAGGFALAHRPSWHSRVPTPGAV